MGQSVTEQRNEGTATPAPAADGKTRQRSRLAENQHNYRAYVRGNLRTRNVKTGPDVIEALLLRGMPEEDSRDDDKVNAELAIILQQWAIEWIKRYRRYR